MNLALPSKIVTQVLPPIDIIARLGRILTSRRWIATFAR